MLRGRKKSPAQAVFRVCAVWVWGGLGGFQGALAGPLMRHCDDDDDDLRAVGPGRCLTTRIQGCQRGLGEGVGVYRGAQNVRPRRLRRPGGARRPLGSALSGEKKALGTPRGARGGASSSIGAPQGGGDTEFALPDPLRGPRDALRGVDMPPQGPWTTVSRPGGGGWGPRTVPCRPVGPLDGPPPPCPG